MDLRFSITADNQQAINALSDTDRAIVRTSKYAEELGKKGEEADKRLAKSFADGEKNAASLERQIDKLGRTKDETTRKTGLLSSAVMRYAGTAALGMAIKATSDHIDRLQELSMQTGLGMQALQKFDAAARLNGGTIETVTRAFGVFQDRLAGGDKSVIRALDKLTISFESIARQTPEQQILELARAVTSVEDPARRANIAVDLFGKSGIALIPTLQAIVDTADDLAPISKRTADDFAKISDAFGKVKTAGMALIANVFAPIGPIMEGVATAVEYAVEKMGASLANLIGPLGTVYHTYQKFWTDATLPESIKDTADTRARMDAWLNFLKRGGDQTGALPEGAGLDPNQLLGYTGTVERQLNDQLREQTRLHKERADAAEDASKKAAKAAKEELAAFNELIAANRALVAAGQARIGESFDLFFGRNFSRYGETVQGTNYWGLTGPPTIPGSVGVPGLPDGIGTPVPNPDLSFMGARQAGPSWWRGGSAQERWAQQWRNAYGDYSSFGSGVTSAGNAFATYGGAIEDIIAGDTQVLRATNVRGRGNRAVKGMMAGAEEGGRYGGPYGAMGGAVIGAIIGAARNPMFEDQMNRVAFNYDQRGISEELAREIEAVTKERFDKDRSAGEVYSLSGILKERPLDSKNITNMTARLRDAFVMKSTGAFDEDELKHVLDSSFGAFADYYNKIGGLADETFTEIIELQRQFGVESEEVADYVKGQSEKALTGLGTFLENATVQSSEAATGLMGAAVLLFEEIKKGPDGIKGAMAEMGPIIAEIDAALTKTGAEASVTFHDMRSLLGTMANEDVAQAVTAVSGLGDTMIGLNNAVLLNEETYRGLARAVTDTRNALVEQGHDGEHVNRLMQRELQTIWELQQDQKYAVDDVTQALLDQATAQGIVGDKFRSAESQMVRALQSIDTSLQGIARVFGVDLPNAAEEGAQGVTDALSRIPRDIGINVNYNDGGYHIPGNERVDGAWRGGYVQPWGIQYLAFGGGIFRPRGTDTVPAMLTPGEGVLSRRGMQALGELNRGGSMGGDTINIEPGAIIVNGTDDPEAVANAVMRKLERRKKLSRTHRTLA